jgi:translation initiation factor 6
MWSPPPSDAELRIYRASVRKSSFIGVYCSVFGDKAIASPVVPTGFKMKLRDLLRAEAAITTVGSVSSVGMMIAMNSRGFVVPKTANDDELAALEQHSKVLVVEDKMSALGNLIVANDKGAVISDLISEHAASQISDFLGVDHIRMSVGKYRTIGSLFAVSNEAGIASPLVDEKTLAQVSSALQIKMVPTTVNDGERLVKLGVLLNDRAIVVGKNTNGVELMSLQALSR